MEPGSFRQELLNSGVNTGGRTARHVIATLYIYSGLKREHNPRRGYGL